MGVVVDGANSRLKELVAALEFLVLRLHNFDAVYYFKQTCLEGFRLPGEGCQCWGPGRAWMGVSRGKTAAVTK
jgi:hypothetical protein